MNDRTRRLRATCRLLLASSAVLASVATPPAHAQRPPGGSVRVASDHWSGSYISRLRERGFLPGLNPLVQPWRAADVARELAALDADTLPEPAREWVRLLAAEFGWRNTGDAPGARAGAMLGGALRASSSKRLDASRPIGEEDAWPRGQVGGWFETGPVTAQLRLLGDAYLTDDPDGQDPGQRRGLRSDLVYLAADFPVASIELGRLGRNWAPVGRQGLLISDAATPYPQVGVELRAWRLVLRGFTGELETLSGQKRYLSAHRLDYESPRLVISVGESMLYAEQSGGLRLRFLNPLEFLFFDAENQPADATQNLMLDLQVWARAGDVTIRAEGMLDDIDVKGSPGIPQAPVRYALAVTSRWTPRGGRWTVEADYEQVSSYAYRTAPEVDRYSYLDRGLGAHYADFDRAMLALEYVSPVPGLEVRAAGVLLRQGEGDFRQPFGDYDAFIASPSLFLGVREDTYRVALAGRYQPVRFAWVAWDLGYNWVRNRGHVQDVDESLFSATGEVGVRVAFPFGSGS